MLSHQTKGGESAWQHCQAVSHPSANQLPRFGHMTRVYIFNRKSLDLVTSPVAAARRWSEQSQILNSLITARRWTQETCGHHVRYKLYTINYNSKVSKCSDLKISISLFITKIENETLAIDISKLSSQTIIMGSFCNYIYHLTISYTVSISFTVSIMYCICCIRLFMIVVFRIRNPSLYFSFSISLQA